MFGRTWLLIVAGLAATGASPAKRRMSYGGGSARSIRLKLLACGHLFTKIDEIAQKRAGMSDETANPVVQFLRQYQLCHASRACEGLSYYHATCNDFKSDGLDAVYDEYKKQRDERQEDLRRLLHYRG